MVTYHHTLPWQDTTFAGIACSSLHHSHYIHTHSPSLIISTPLDSRLLFFHDLVCVHGYLPQARIGDILESFRLPADMIVKIFSLGPTKIPMFKEGSSKPALTTDITWSRITVQDTIKTTPKRPFNLHSTVNFRPQITYIKHDYDIQ